MKYKMIINVPNEKFPTEISLTQEQMDGIEPALNNKKIVRIDNSYFNTAYIVKIIPDVDAMRIEENSQLKLEKTTQTTQDKYNRQAIDELKEKLFKKA